MDKEDLIKRTLIELRLSDFITAVNNVDRKYVEDFILKEEKSKCTVSIERVFAYELYHQIRKIMEDPITAERYTGLVLNGEIHKYGNPYYGISNTEIDCFPDLVMHVNNHCCKEAHQVWLCEIKREGNKEIMKDINKMLDFPETAAFQQYICLYFGCSSAHELKTMFVNLIDETKIHFDNSNYKKIVCVFYDGCQCVKAYLNEIVEDKLKATKEGGKVI